METALIWRLAILAVLAGILAFLFFAPAVRLRRATGSWPVALHRVRVPGQLPNVTALGAVLLAEILLVVLYVARGPAALSVWRAPPVVPVLGLILATGGIAFVAAAVRQMGASYRFGIDDQRTELVQHGVFAVVRNPIYTGIVAMLSGFALIAPCPWTAVLAPAAAIAVARQARLEERHLLAMHGDRYRAYASRVGRFLPGIGRLAGAAPSTSARTGERR